MAENLSRAKRYSQAVFEIAQEHQELDKWQSDLQKLAVLTQNPDFISVMENPRFPNAEKSRFLSSQPLDISPLAMNLANILIEKGIFGLVQDIYAGYQELLDRSRGVEKATVTTAVNLDQEEQRKLVERLSNISGKKVILTVNVDEGIIGGIVAKVGGKIIDGSTRSRLAALRNELYNAGS